VPPPAASPPDPSAPPGQMGFTFNRADLTVGDALAVIKQTAQRLGL
jgi:hypothetical protein